MKKSSRLAILKELEQMGECKVSIKRIAPAWAAESIGTIPVYDSERIDPVHVLKGYGGGTYYLKFRNLAGHYIGHENESMSGAPIVQNPHDAPKRPEEANMNPHTQQQILDAVQALTAKINNIEMCIAAMLQR